MRHAHFIGLQIRYYIVFICFIMIAPKMTLHFPYDVKCTLRDVLQHARFMVQCYDGKNQI